MACVVVEEGRDPLKFIVFILSTSLDAREGTEYNTYKNKRRGEKDSAGIGGDGNLL